MILVVGLGNPGPRYENTKHNVGFMLVDCLLKKTGALAITTKKHKGLVYKTKDLIFLKPLTFMNLSGESIKAVRSFFNVEKTIVIHDDLDLPLGALRFKFGGSNAGHNGLKSIDYHIGKDYFRVRIGIGRPELKDDVADYVLSKFSLQEEKVLAEILEVAGQAVLSFKNKDLHFVQENFTKKPLSK